MGSSFQIIQGNYVITIGTGGPILKGIKLGMKSEKADKVYDKEYRKKHINGFFYITFPSRFSNDSFVARMCIVDITSILDFFNIQTFDDLVKALISKI